MKKIGFIGFGNMAQAIVKGWLKTNTVDPNLIYASAAHYDKLVKNAEKYGVHACVDNVSVVENADVLIIAIKPYQMLSAMPELLEKMKGKMVISIVAGWYFAEYEQLGMPAHHITAVPNTPIAVADGIAIVEDLHSLTTEEYELFQQLFETICLLEVFDREHASIAGTIVGCTPAYTAMYMEALGDAGVKHGLPRATAYRLIAKMLVGTGNLYLENGEHPGIMKDAVCSPNGTTIVGVAALERNGFRGAVIDAIDCVQNKKS